MIDFQSINIEIPDFNSEFFVLSFTKLLEQESKVLGDISIIFVTDSYLLEMNQKYLDHDYYTDIITFDYCVTNIVSGDLFISVDRVQENAGIVNVGFLTELHRVMIHGILHLCGYKDKTDEEKRVMRALENKYLN
ncbi:MAG: rRNA maturation RNase YbeY [Bacteroidetes bacterium]|nr:rRNA maturation RNase YbeY [Bacteroidota bacterium]